MSFLPKKIDHPGPICGTADEVSVVYEHFHRPGFGAADGNAAPAAAGDRAAAADDIPTADGNATLTAAGDRAAADGFPAPSGNLAVQLCP